METVYENGDIWLVRVEVPVICFPEEQEAKIREMAGLAEYDEHREEAVFDLGTMMPFEGISSDGYREEATLLHFGEGQQKMSIYMTPDAFLKEYIAYIERHPERFGIDVFPEETVRYFREDHRTAIGG